MTDETDPATDPPDDAFDVEHRPERTPVFDTDTPRAIPFYVIVAAVEDAGPDDEYVIVRSDNDHLYAETLEEANRKATEFRSQVDVVSPIPHTVQVIALQEVAPEA